LNSEEQAGAANSPLRMWQVGALCKAISTSLESQFNPVRVGGEISGFVRAASGHCYFNLKDATGQIRCAAFKRVASAFDFSPRDGDQVELQGRLGVYEQRGELQLVVEAMRRAGQGALFERFVQIKARLQAQGLFDAQRKRPLPHLVRGIGVVTSLGAAALHDVLSALQRRVPHIPVTVVPAAVQGEAAPQALCAALQKIYRLQDAAHGPIDVILLVRGGGSMEDLWAFNDETLAQVIAQSPVPLVSGVGHETDFTIADFVADLRAPTPTAAAELAAQPTALWRDVVDDAAQRLQAMSLRVLDREAQHLDTLQARIARPSAGVYAMRQRLRDCEHRASFAAHAGLTQRAGALERTAHALERGVVKMASGHTVRLDAAALRLGLLDPSLVLARGYAWLTDVDGRAVGSARGVQPAQLLHAQLHDGRLSLQTLNVEVK
jgi:exodeoxyribonuclease VII large subunit